MLEKLLQKFNEIAIQHAANYSRKEIYRPLGEEFWAARDDLVKMIEKAKKK